MRDALTVRDLGFTYPAYPAGIGWLMGRRRRRVDAFEGITFNLHEGTRACLMGPNGAGKSTLLKVILGLLAPTRGSTRILGVDSRDLGARRLVGLVHPDERSFYWRLTVRENLAFFGGLWGLPPRRAMERAEGAAADAGLSDWLQKPFSDLSTGTRQKVAIARALLHEPPLLVMDEPTRSLDPPSAAHFRQWLTGPVCARRTLLIATHNPAEASALSDRCLVLSRGRLVHDGAPLEEHALSRLMEAPA